MLGERTRQRRRVAWAVAVACLASATFQRVQVVFFESCSGLFRSECETESRMCVCLPRAKSKLHRTTAPHAMPCCIVI